jgi:hypothetical protein
VRARDCGRDLRRSEVVERECGLRALKATEAQICQRGRAETLRPAAEASHTQFVVLPLPALEKGENLRRP